MNFLLSSLTKHGFKGVPRSLYRLKKLQALDNNLVVNKLESGLFSYFGIKENLELFVHRQKLLSCNRELLIHAKINIDGLPLYKSSSTCLWPILMSFGSDPHPYPIAIHLGRQKPALDSYLRDFIDEVKILREEGCRIGGILIKLGTIIFVCDAPARAHLQCVLGHTAKKGCSYCDAEGRYLMDRIVFPVETGHHRSDEDYKNMSQNNQTKLSLLVSIVGLNTHFPVD